MPVQCSRAAQQQCALGIRSERAVTSEQRESGPNLHLSAQCLKHVAIEQLVDDACNSLLVVICGSNVVLEHDTEKCNWLMDACCKQAPDYLMLDSSTDHKTVSIRSKDGNCNK